jgi:hypothetical protein
VKAKIPKVAPDAGSAKHITVLKMRLKNAMTAKTD